MSNLNLPERLYDEGCPICEKDWHECMTFSLGHDGFRRCNSCNTMWKIAKPENVPVVDIVSSDSGTADDNAWREGLR